jgi:hypothetical protein
MKTLHKLLLIIFVFCLISFKMSAQTDKDTVAVLLKCINIPQLDQYYSIVSDSKLKEVSIMKQNSAFPENLIKQMGYVNLSFLSKGEIYNKKVTPFILFEQLQINQSSASARYLLNYDYSVSTNYKILAISVLLIKEGDSWIVTESNIKGR